MDNLCKKCFSHSEWRIHTNSEQNLTIVLKIRRETLMSANKGYKKRKTLGITEDDFSALDNLSKELEKVWVSK